MLKNSSFLRRKTLISFSVAMALLTQSQSLLAQVKNQTANQQAENQEIERIVVQARGRKETIIEVPLSEKFFSAAEISDARIKAVDDFIGLTPGITMANSQDAGTNFITIRTFVPSC